MSVIDDLNRLGRALADQGLVIGAGGNISARDGERMVIKPSGYDMDKLRDDQWAIVEIATGKHLSGPRPASEWELHLRALRTRPEANFVCHAHPPIAVGLVSGGADLEAYSPDFVAFVDRVEHVPFIMPAGPELALAVEKALATGAPAVALRNHGFVTLGRTANEALVRMRCIEDGAKTQMAALIAGKPRPLSAQEQDAIRRMDVEAYRRKVLGNS
ncbi:MAG: class II aldolase/adducin family protein [Planctomycetota bacterium]|nr:class II aldolase/adducin family protein [Planctomycetota bacterium]